MKKSSFLSIIIVGIVFFLLSALLESFIDVSHTPIDHLQTPPITVSIDTLSTAPLTASSASVSLPPELEATRIQPDSLETHITNNERSQAKDLPAISPYDKLFQKEAEAIGWDWYVLAAISFYESNFRPHVVGPGRATGLMGIMPATGRRFGYNMQQLKVPANNIRAGAQTLANFENSLFANVPDQEQRSKLTLVAYMSGQGHVQDAVRLAKKHGDDPNQYDNSVEKYLKLLAQPKYYRDPVVRHGSFRGSRVTQTIAKIFKKAQEFRDKHNK